MTSFEVVYEDPDYAAPVEAEVYLEPGSVRDFSNWSPTAQQRLVEDIYSPHRTINS